jgi:hypothetical protein
MKVEYLGSKELILSETSKSKVLFIKTKPEIIQKETVNHHILLADVSGSMSRNIKDLKDRLIKTLDALLQIPNSYVSVITYSGHNQSKIILQSIKCDQISYAMSNVYNVLEKELYTKGVTVISEPLEQSISICKSLTGICDKHHIALFTDGCLVPWNWSENTEREKCFKVAEICNEENIFLNAIGFGQYYDREFLKELIDVAGNGCVIHIDVISDYSDVILKVIKKVNAENVISSVIKTDTGKIFNINNSSMKESHTFNNESIFALIYNDYACIHIDDEKYEIFKKDTMPSGVLFQIDLTEEVLDEFYYSLSKYYLQNDDIDNYEFIVKMLGDTALYEKTKNSYSFIEKGNAINKVSEVIEDKSKRYLKGKNPIIETLDNEQLCLLEILQMIMEDKRSVLYWDLETPYHRITQGTINNEDNIKFVRQEKGLVPITSLSIGSQKLNINIKVAIPGKVIDTVSGLEKDAVVYREFNLINGGNVNVPYINAFVTPEVHQKLFDNNINIVYNLPDTIIKIPLNGIKSTNKRILKSMSMSEIADNLYQIADLKCKQYAINKLIEESLGIKSKLEMANFTIEEQEVRKILRIDENGIYKPESVEKDNDSPFEIYPAIHLTWGINKFPDKKLKEQYVEEVKNLIINDLKLSFGKDNEIIFDALTLHLKNIKEDIRKRELNVNCVRVASAMMNKSPFIWDSVIEKDKKTNDKILNRNMIVGGKNRISQKDIDNKIIEEKKWIQLIKSN